MTTKSYIAIPSYDITTKRYKSTQNTSTIKSYMNLHRTHNTTKSYMTLHITYITTKSYMDVHEEPVAEVGGQVYMLGVRCRSARVSSGGCQPLSQTAGHYPL